jgi:hypothetical protein
VGPLWLWARKHCLLCLHHRYGPVQNPQSRIDELLFREPTTKISAPNSKYNCSIDQKVEVGFLSFYMENQKAVNLFEFKRNVWPHHSTIQNDENLTSTFWSIEQLYFEFGAEILVVGSRNNNSSILLWGILIETKKVTFHAT